MEEILQDSYRFRRDEEEEKKRCLEEDKIMEEHIQYVKELQEANDKLTAKNSEIRKKLRQKAKECENLKKAMEQKKSQANDDGRDLHNATARTEALEGELQKAQLKFTQLENEKEELQNSCIRLESKIKEMENESMAQIHVNDNLKSEVERQEMELQELRKENEELCMQRSEDHEWKTCHKYRATKRPEVTWTKIETKNQFSPLSDDADENCTMDENGDKEAHGGKVIHSKSGKMRRRKTDKAVAQTFEDREKEEGQKLDSTPLIREPAYAPYSVNDAGCGIENLAANIERHEQRNTSRRKVKEVKGNRRESMMDEHGDEWKDREQATGHEEAQMGRYSSLCQTIPRSRSETVLSLVQSLTLTVSLALISVLLPPPFTLV